MMRQNLKIAILLLLMSVTAAAQQTNIEYGQLAKDQVYEFLFIASPLKLRGATASPLRPIAIPIKRK